MKYFQSQEILTSTPPVVKFSTTSGFAVQGITAGLSARHLYKFGKHCPKAAVPNLWVATPRGVAIDFHWGRHWSSDILQNPCTIAYARSCLCQKLCSVKIDYRYI